MVNLEVLSMKRESKPKYALSRLAVGLASVLFGSVVFSVSTSNVQGANGQTCVGLKENTSAQAPSQDQTISGIIKSLSKGYDKFGNDTGTRYNKYTPIKYLLSIVKIKDKTYYKLADNNHYVKIINITGKKRTLKHKAYAYNSKAEKNFLKKFAEGEDLITYGSQVTLKDGKKYYQIGKESYVRASNFVR